MWWMLHFYRWFPSYRWISCQPVNEHWLYGISPYNGFAWLEAYLMYKRAHLNRIHWMKLSNVILMDLQASFQMKTRFTDFSTYHTHTFSVGLGGTPWRLCALSLDLKWLIWLDFDFKTWWRILHSHKFRRKVRYDFVSRPHLNNFQLKHLCAKHWIIFWTCLCRRDEDISQNNM